MSELEGTQGQASAEGDGSQALSSDGEAKVFDAEYVRQLRKEAAKWRKDAQDYKAQIDQFEQAQMTEAERLKAQVEAAQKAAQEADTRARQAVREAVLAREASKHQVDAKLLGRLVDVEFDADGKPVNVEASVNQVLARYPQLKATAGGSNPANPGRQAKLTMEDVKRMSTAEINARWAEVQEAMAGK